MLSGRGLCDELITRPEESFRLWCVVVCDLETSRIGAPYIHEISNLRVKLKLVSFDHAVGRYRSDFEFWNHVTKERQENVFHLNFSEVSRQRKGRKCVCVCVLWWNIKGLDYNKRGCFLQTRFEVPSLLTP